MDIPSFHLFASFVFLFSLFFFGWVGDYRETFQMCHGNNYITAYFMVTKSHGNIKEKVNPPHPFLIIHDEEVIPFFSFFDNHVPYFQPVIRFK